MDLIDEAADTQYQALCVSDGVGDNMGRIL